MAVEFLSKAVPIFAVGVASAFGILKVIEGSKKQGASSIIQEFDDRKEKLLTDIEEESAVLQRKVTDVYDSLDRDLQTLLQNWNEEAVRANPDQAKQILDELAKIGFPGASKVKLAADWVGTNLLAPVITFLGEEASKLLQPPKTAASSPPPGIILREEE